MTNVRENNDMGHADFQALRDMANRIRLHSVRATSAAGSGHPTSCASIAEITSVLFFHTMRYRVQKPRDPNSDRFVLSKGHAAPALYAAWAEAGLFPVEDLLNLRKVDSDLEGHPTPRLEFIDVATGSLGQGLSCAAGMAYTGKYFDRASYRVFCVVGDGESAEGSIWEAMAFASFYKLDNLVAIFDVNRFGQSDLTALEHDLDAYRIRVEAFGWNTYVVDGHSVEELVQAFAAAEQVKDKPSCVIAKTFKGKGFPGSEDQAKFHGKVVGDKDLVIDSIEKQLVSKGSLNLEPRLPIDDAPPVNIQDLILPEPPNYRKGDRLAPRVGFASASSKLGKLNKRVITLDGDMRGSTFSNKFRETCPDQFLECFIAEQNMVGVAIGCATRDRTVVFLCTYGSFLTRAYDQIRMGAISQTNINILGSHPGVSVGADGPSQMGMEDMAMFRAVPNCTVFYPSDAVSMEGAVKLAACTKGIAYIRSTRSETSVIYDNEERFHIGEAKVVRQHPNDQVTVVAAGVTLDTALQAAAILETEGIHIRVIDPFTVKPLDRETILSAARATGGRVLTVEDHYPEGGIGEAVAAAIGDQSDIRVRILAVRDIPRSGPGDVLLDKYGLGPSSIIKAIKEDIGAN
ncbi:transketolase-like protein 2 [Lingula anatina]|uniref:transketolase n=1 Tax=Lingula anatina TaxID=7574 RepID=A0A1S3J2X0_LINAN|nr:transketolase-like protein 2 [Lingula anatina]|eukprot:XP_013404204.1 transketolase-like protein 2 [Lingula anatina]